MIAVHELQSPGSARREASRGSRDALTADIKRHGVQVPLLVAALGGGHLILKGHRRLRAAKQAGLTEVPCLVLPLASDEDEAYELAASWNALAEGLRDIDLIDLIMARCAQRLGEDPSVIAAAWKKVAKDPSADVDQFRTVKQAVRDFGAGDTDAFLAHAVKLLRLPDGLLSPLRQGALSSDQALALSGVKDIELRTVFQSRAEAGEMTALEIKRAAKQAREQSKAGEDSDGDSGGSGSDGSGDEEDFEELEAAIEQKIQNLPEKRRAQARKYLRSLRGLFRGEP